MFIASLLLLAIGVAISPIKPIFADIQNKYDIDDDIFNHHGENIEIISETGRDRFHISDRELKQVVDRTFGAYPTDVYVRSPTPWNDLYWSYGWKQVQRVFHSVSAQVLDKNATYDVILSQICDNKLNVTIECTATLQQAVSNTVEHTRSNTHEVGVGGEMGYEFNYLVGKAGVKIKMNYKTSWTNTHKESQQVTLGTTNSVTYPLGPNQKAIAKLQAKRGTMKLKLGYSEKLSGQVAVNYAKSYKGHHFWGLDINYLLRGAKKDQKISSSEEISIGFYSEAKIVVSDEATRESIMEFDVPIQIIVRGNELRKDSNSISASIVPGVEAGSQVYLPIE